MKTSLKILFLTLLISTVWAQYPAQWTVDAHAFEHTMTLTGELFINDELQLEATNAVAAFHNDECRGVVEGTTVGDEVIFFLLIYGNTVGDSLEFRAWDATIGNVVLLDEEMLFSSGAALGEVDAPYQLSGTNSLSYIEAFADVFEQAEDTDESVPFDILGNDVYDRSLAMVVTFPIEPQHGMLFENVDQTFTFVSDLNFFGQDSFQYRVAHEYGADSAWVQVNITPIDDPLGAFHLQSPHDNSMFEHGGSSFQEFTWEIPEELDGDPISYSLNVYDGVTLDSSYSTDANTFTVNLEDHNRDTWLDWHVVAYDGWGWTVSADTFSIQISSLLNTDPISYLPERFSLGQNYPNPFNPATKISYELPEAAIIILQVFDIHGKCMANEMLGTKAQGSHLHTFDLSNPEYSNLRSGIYLYRLSALTLNSNTQLFKATRRMLILK